MRSRCCFEVRSPAALHDMTRSRVTGAAIPLDIASCRRTTFRKGNSLVSKSGILGILDEELLSSRHFTANILTDCYVQTHRSNRGELKSCGGGDAYSRARRLGSLSLPSARPWRRILALHLDVGSNAYGNAPREIPVPARPERARRERRGGDDPAVVAVRLFVDHVRRVQVSRGTPKGAGAGGSS